MTPLVTQRVHCLTDTLTELKSKVRTALATELATALGTAVRDVLIVALVDRLVAPSRSGPTRRTSGWYDDEPEDRDRWGERNPWGDPDEYDTHHRTYQQAERDEDAGREPITVVPVAAAVAIGVNVGRWWLGRQGSITGSIGLATLTTALGLGGGPVAHAVLAVLSAATDVLTAESALARSERF